MKKLTSLLAFICLPLATTVSAHDTPVQYNQISFSVSAEADIANDELVIVMASLEQGRDLESLADKVNKTMAWAIKEAGTQANITAQTMNYQTQPRYEKGKQTGWQVSQSLSLKSTSSEDLSELMGKLQSRLQVQSASYQITAAKKKQLEDELTTLALQRFSDKAEQITRALQAKKYKYRQKLYSTSNTSAKAKVKRLNFSSSGNDDLMLDARSEENLNSGCDIH